MANNRMYLVCSVCCPTDEDVRRQICEKRSEPDPLLMIAKYYPTPGWYSWSSAMEGPGDDPPRESKMTEWLEAHEHDEKREGYGHGTMYGPTHFRLAFEEQP